MSILSNEKASGFRTHRAFCLDETCRKMHLKPRVLLNNRQTNAQMTISVTGNHRNFNKAAVYFANREKQAEKTRSPPETLAQR